MRTTDYSKIANRYDSNRVRHLVSPDDYVGMLAERGARVLDLACGTGNYLVAQQARFPGNRIEWHGLDASEQMLAVARGKTLAVELQVGQAER